MPLHNGIPYDVEDLKDIKDDEQLWVVPDSGEACRNYEDFRDLLREYRKRVWSCKYTGRGGLTYKEAEAEEQKNKHLVQKVLQAFPVARSTVFLTADLSPCSSRQSWRRNARPLCTILLWT